MTASEVVAAVKRMGRESWLLFVAVTVANASNYAFHVAVSRLLGPGEYGQLGSVLAVLTVLSVPLAAVQTTVAKRWAEASSEPGGGGAAKRDWTARFAAAARIGIGLMVVLIVASPALTAYLRLDSHITSVAVAVYLLPAILLAVSRGALQGDLRFRELAFVSLVPVLVRVVVGVLAVQLGAGVPGATVVTVLGDAVGLAIALRLIGPLPGRGLGTRQEVRPFLKEVAPVAAALFAMWVLIEIDLVMARHYLSSEDAGNYAAAGLLARAVLFIPGAVSVVALPRFADLRGRGREAYGWLIACAVVVAGLGGCAALILSLFRSEAIGLTFGARFAPAALVLPTLAFAMVGFGLANLAVLFHVAAGSRVFHLLWVGVAASVGAFGLFHGSADAVANVVLVSAWPVAAVGFFTARQVALSPTPLATLPREITVRVAEDRDADVVPELSVVVPCYNAGDALRVNISTIRRTLDRLGRSYELIVVSDGSTDGCVDALDCNDPAVHVLHYGRRHGKGIALRVGMARAVGRYIAFLDCDGDLDSTDLLAFLAVMDLYNPDLVVGSKRHPLSRVSYPLSRRAMSWMYKVMIRLLFGLNVHDTQTGMKLIRREVLDEVLPRMLEKRFAFDLEFLVVAKRLGFTRLFEAPVHLDYQFRSTVSARAVIFILLDTAAIFYRRYIVRYYDQSLDGAASRATGSRFSSGRPVNQASIP